jgi:tetratricopeptide (TPR) repeat protein
MGIALLWKPGLEQDAAAAFSEATRLTQGAYGARNAAGIQRVVAVAYTQKGKLDDAITAYREAARLDPDDPHSRHHLGIALDKQGLLDESIAAHRESARLQPQEPVAHSALGAVLIKKGLWDEAAGAYRAAIRLQPDNAWLHHLLGDACAQARRSAEAEAAYREAIRLEPNDGGRHHNLGDVLRDQHKFSDAAAEYAEAIRLRPDVHASHYGLGSVYAFAGHWDKAAAPFGRAAELKPDDLASSYRWATLCVYNNDPEDYRRACGAMLDRFGETSDVQLADFTAKACSLAPDLAGDATKVLKLADLAMAGTEENPARKRFEITKGLVDYRAGRFGAAADIIVHSAPSNEGSHQDALAFSILCLARYRLENGDDARKALADAQRILSTKMPRIEKGETFNDDWCDWLHAQIICREAEKLLAEGAGVKD